ncbi:hypothetical protein H4219_000741 [Mycoemilia scoparia]|uniref:DUF4211 domain-containing protein n=1 Tax=Mycoemilia scoparia TaxID=417184 RepID=A0A9W8ABG1_9FUNG|nr:hypothetical protein H4219_000741 [Mycoemilia scoparia]
MKLRKRRQQATNTEATAENGSNKASSSSPATRRKAKTIKPEPEPEPPATPVSVKSPKVTYGGKGRKRKRSPKNKKEKATAVQTKIEDADKKVEVKRQEDNTPNTKGSKSKKSKVKAKPKINKNEETKTPEKALEKTAANISSKMVSKPKKSPATGENKKEKRVNATSSFIHSESTRNDGDTEEEDADQNHIKYDIYDDDDDEDDDDPDLDKYETDESEEEIIPPKRKLNKKQNKRKIESDVSNDESGNEATARAVKRSSIRNKRNLPPLPKSLHPANVANRTLDNGDNDNDDEVLTQMSKRRQPLRSRSNILDDSDDDAGQFGRENNGNESDDLSGACLTETRMRSRPKMSKYREIFENARNRIRNQDIPASQSNSIENDTPILDDDIDDSASMSSISGTAKKLATLNGQNYNDPIELDSDTGSNNDDPEDDTAKEDDIEYSGSEESIGDFIASDDEPVQGEPTSHAGNINGPGSSHFNEMDDAVPEEFSLSFARDLYTSFQIYAQFLIHCHANCGHAPKMDKNTERYFEVAGNYVEQKLQSIKDSVVGSSAWYRHYINDLNKYPALSSTYIKAIPGCDACHFADKRMAHWRIELCGIPYDRKTLQPLNDDDDDGTSNNSSDESSSDENTSDSDSDAPIRKRRSRKPKKKSKKSKESHSICYNVGRFCYQRSVIYHELQHFRHELYNLVGMELVQLGWTEDRFKKLKTSRSKAAETLLQKLDDSGRTRVVSNFSTNSKNQSRFILASSHDF